MTASGQGYVHSLRCPCGLELTGTSEDELVTTANEHLREAHPRLAGSYSRDDILALAYRRPIA